MSMPRPKLGGFFTNRREIRWRLPTGQPRYLVGSSPITPPVLTPQVLNTLMHIHGNTEMTHGDVAEHNIVYSFETVDGTPRCLATLVDFGNAAFKDVSLLGVPN